MKNISRRSFLLGSCSAVVGGFAGTSMAWSSSEPFVTPLTAPPVIDPQTTGGVLDLTAQGGRHSFVAQGEAQTLGYNGSVLGPILRVRSGETVQVKFTNALDVPTTVHWHGLFVPSEMDGGPHNLVQPGATWEPVLKINQRASTAWFHPHPHGDTARQVYMGLAGLIYVEDAETDALALPNRHGLDDFPIILQDRSFDAQGALVYDNSPMGIMHGARGTQVIVNGAVAPLATVHAGQNRLRLLNGANARNFLLSFADERTFQVIGNDNGLLAAPVKVSELLIAPGERYEVLVDFSEGGTTELVTLPDHNGRFGTGMMDRVKSGLSFLTSSAEPILRFAADASIPKIAYVLPEVLSKQPLAAEADAVATRTFLLDSMMAANMPMMGGGMMQSMDHAQMNMGGEGMAGMSGLQMGMTMAINGKPFDMGRIDTDVKLGSLELWEVGGTEMMHPFHIHGATFLVLEQDGSPPPAHMTGWKDTVLVNQRTKLLVKFDQPASREKPFMYHCHILEHEDAGMMAQFATA